MPNGTQRLMEKTPNRIRGREKKCRWEAKQQIGKNNDGKKTLNGNNKNAN